MRDREKQITNNIYLTTQRAANKLELVGIAKIVEVGTAGRTLHESEG